jgi:hypothetical protein
MQPRVCRTSKNRVLLAHRTFITTPAHSIVRYGTNFHFALTTLCSCRLLVQRQLFAIWAQFSSHNTTQIVKLHRYYTRHIIHMSHINHMIHIKILASRAIASGLPTCHTHPAHHPHSTNKKAFPMPETLAGYGTFVALQSPNSLIAPPELD